MKTIYAPLNYILLSFVLALSTHASMAQNEALSSMYNFNKLLINPAVAGRTMARVVPGLSVM